MSGLKQRELANILDVTPGHISLVENDKAVPSLKFFQGFAACVNLRPSGLMHLVECVTLDKITVGDAFFKTEWEERLDAGLTGGR